MRFGPSLPVAVLLGILLAGCGPPPEPEPLGPPPELPPGPTLVSPASLPPVTPAGPATPGVFPEDRALDCDGHPDGDAVLALLRANRVLGADVEATISQGPLCAGTWQYAVVSVPDLDPLQVVTEGPPDDLALVTHGTNVCTVEVRAHAPLGIRSAAACVG